MSGTPALSILIPWCERDELRLTLAANAPLFRAHDAEVLVINCGGSRRRLRDLIAASEVTGVRQLDIAAQGFNKSLALNVGLFHSRADTVLTLDADVVLLGDVLGEARALADERSFITIEWVHESEPAASVQSKAQAILNTFTAGLVKSAFVEFAFRDGTTVQYQLSRRDVFGNMRAGPGLLLARRDDLLGIQGLNSDLRSWGWEDDDVLVRLQYARGLRRIQKGAALHLTHDDARRGAHATRRESDQINFLKCCWNYNNGVFLGTYDADVAWAADRVTETRTEAVTREWPPSVVRCSQGHSPSFMARPVYCGNESGTERNSRRAARNRPASIEQLLLEATLLKSPLQHCGILHVGIGDSGLARRLASSCRRITGVAFDEAEQSMAVGLGLKNYDVVVCSTFSDAFCKHLPLDAYDIIVDDNIAGYACCQRHLKTLMENYSSLLAPTGWLATTQGTDVSATSNGRKLSEADLACLAGQFNLRVTKTGYDVYTLRRQDGALRERSSSPRAGIPR